MSKPEIRKECMKYAAKYVKIQTKQFQDLGIFGDFDEPYLTFKPAVRKRHPRDLRRAGRQRPGLQTAQAHPLVVGCETALADAELEYKDISSPSIFVNFPATMTAPAKLIELGLVTASRPKRPASAS
jgi:isoleucyl-tRNA synthetase